MSVNKVFLIGNLGDDPTKMYTQSGTAVGNMRVATNQGWNDKAGNKHERTEWHRIVVFGKLAELCHEYLRKGRQVHVEGRLQTRQWTDRDGVIRYTTEIVARTVEFLGGRPQNAPEGPQTASDAEPELNSDSYGPPQE